MNNNFLTLPQRLKNKNDKIVLGILNLSPDSFSGDGIVNEDEIKERVKSMIEAGVDVIDIGAQSTRPGGIQISEEEEIRVIKRTFKLLKGISISQPISVDTTRAQVAQVAIEGGATIINDISGGTFDPSMYEVLKSHPHVLYIFGHLRGDFASMHAPYSYTNVVDELILFAKKRIEIMETYSITRDRLIFDPGIGFSKRKDENVSILKNINVFKDLNLPVAIGLSRKRFIKLITEDEENEALDVYTLSLNMLALSSGASIIRTHETSRTMKMMRIMRELNPNL